MEFILFNLFSTLESVGMLLLMLAIFRFNIKRYIAHLVFASFILSQTSYYMRDHFYLDHYVPITMIIFMFLLIWLMFRVQIFYAAIMTIIGYLGFLSLQGVLILIAISLNVMTFEDVGPFSIIAYVMQTLTTLICGLITIWFTRKRIGFTFIPLSEIIRVSFKNENAIILVIVLLGIIVTGIHLQLSLQSIYSFITIITMIIIYSIVLIYYAIRRERQDD